MVKNITNSTITQSQLVNVSPATTALNSHKTLSVKHLHNGSIFRPELCERDLGAALHESKLTKAPVNVDKTAGSTAATPRLVLPKPGFPSVEGSCTRSERIIKPESAGAQYAVSSHQDEPNLVSRIAAQLAFRKRLERLEAEKEFRRSKEVTREPFFKLRHNDPSNLMRHERLKGTRAQAALGGFLKRHSVNMWMKQQRNYRELAGLMAAYALFSPPFFSAGEGVNIQLSLGAVDPIALLNCGWLGKDGTFQRCHQPYYCPSCNRWERAEPAKREFMPAFYGKGKWYGITVMIRSNPRGAGVKIQTGNRPNGKPRKKWLLRLNDPRFAKYHKFGLDDGFAGPEMISDALFNFHLWLTNNRYFDGLAGCGDVSCTIFPHKRGIGGVGDTVNFHVHAFGNSSREFTPEVVKRMFLGCFDSLLAELKDCLDFCGYPDILLVPLDTPAALEKTINYVYKPIQIAKYYDKALGRGCNREGLNYQFHQMVIGCHHLLPGSAKGFRYGNMNSKSRHRYIGVPQATSLSEKQLERYFERCETGQALAWEHLRHENHLQTTKKKKGAAKSEPRPSREERFPESVVPSLPNPLSRYCPQRNKSQLRRRGWTKGMLKRWLGEPDFIVRRQPYGKIHQYHVDRISQCEANGTWQREWLKWAKRREKYRQNRIEENAIGAPP